MDALDIYHSMEDVQEARREKEREQIAWNLYNGFQAKANLFRGPLLSCKHVTDVPPGKKTYWEVVTSTMANTVDGTPVPGPDLTVRVYGPRFFLVNVNGSFHTRRTVDEAMKLINDPFGSI